MSGIVQISPVKSGTLQVYWPEANVLISAARIQSLGSRITTRKCGSKRPTFKRNNFSESAILRPMNDLPRRKSITSRVIRPGVKFEDESYWDTATPEERINAVWELTRFCYFWQTGDTEEPRLQKSITRVIRPNR